MNGNIVSLLIAAGSFTADQAAKLAADKKLSDGRQIKLAGGVITLQRAENSGFAKNRLSDRKKLVVGASTIVFAICVVLYAITLSKPGFHVMKAGLGLVLGGAAGNVFDRIRRGKVTDFIIAKPINSIIFNLADFFILTGAIVTVMCDLLKE
ncbi:MAG: signal peptidase II [Lachnospiraceae bacterium]|nr:signal peptidase II [Lachnospiraceae bacterium]